MTAEQGRAPEGAPQRVLTVAAVARRLGVAPSTLRTWDRRYGLGPSAHTAGSHRRYGPDDLHRLSVMRGLTLEGVPPAEAAQIALGGRPGDRVEDDRVLVVALEPDAGAAGGPGPVTDLDGLAGHGGVDTDLPLPGLAPYPGLLPLAGLVAGPLGPGPAVRPLAGAATEPGRGSAVWITRDPLPGAQRAVPPAEAIDPAEGARPAGTVPPPQDLDPAGPAVDPLLGVQALLGPAGVPGRAGGGRVLSLPDASPRTRGLARAAMALDTFEQQRILRDAIAAYGVVGTWETMVVPVLAGLGERWRATGEGVDVEHAFCEAVAGALRGVMLTLYRPRNAVPVLLACADGDQHSLPLHVLAAALAEEEVGCRMLGAALPAPALVSAVRRTGPAVVFVYARLPVQDAAVLRELPRQRPAPRVVLGGPGWDGVVPPPAAVRVDTLSAAIAALLPASRL